MDASAAALLISVFSLVLAGLSLGWQVAQWLLSGGRPRAVLMHGLADMSQAWVGPVGKDGVGFDTGNLQRQGINGTSVVGIQVVNRGRAPVVVETVVLLPRGGVMRFIPVGERIGPEMPYTLQPGANVSWYLSTTHAEVLVQSSREVLNETVSGVYMSAQLAVGKTIETRRTLVV